MVLKLLRYTIESGEQMNSLSPSIIMTFVFCLVAGFAGNAWGLTEDEKKDRADAEKRCGVDNVEAIGSGGSFVFHCKDQNDGSKDKLACRSSLTDINKFKNKFISYCQDSEDTIPKTRVSECVEFLSTCSQVSQGEQSFSAVGSLVGMPEIAGILGSGSKGKCSKYTQDKLDSLIDKAQDKMDRKQEKALDAAKKQAEDEEKYEEARQKKTEDFLKQQEDKAEAELKSEEDQRNQEANFQKQQQDYEAKLRQLEDDVFAIQKAQQLLIKKRELDIANLKGAVLAARLKCNAEVKQAINGLKPGAGKAGSFSGAQGQIGEAQQLYLACMDEKTSKRIQDAEQYKVDMERFDRQVDNKDKEIKAIKASMETMISMFKKAQADAETKKQKDEESFMKKQAAKWQELLSLDNNMNQKRIKNAEAIAKAKSDTMTASNQLIKLQSQEAIGDKSPTEVKRDYLGDYNAAKENYDQMNCDVVLGKAKSQSATGGTGRQ